MSEEKNVMNNPLMVWGVFILIPIATFGLYVYEVFFKDEVASNNTDKLYKEARANETKGNLLKAYINYSTLAEIHKDSQAGKQAQKRLREMKKNLEVKILSLAGNKRWSDLRKKKDEVAKLLPERLPWLEEVLSSKGKTSQKSTNNNSPNGIAELREKVDLLVAEEQFTQAIELCKRESLKNKNRKFQKQAKQILAHIHYEYATMKKNRLLSKIEGASIGDFKNDFPEEILEIRAHYRRFLKMSANSDQRRLGVKEFLKKID